MRRREDDARTFALEYSTPYYADDFVVMCDTKAACERAERRVREILAWLGLELHRMPSGKPCAGNPHARF